MNDLNFHIKDFSPAAKVLLTKKLTEKIESLKSPINELQPFPELLKLLAQRVEKALSFEKESKILKEINTADEERDNAQRAMVYHLVALALRQDLIDISAAAKQLYNIIFPEDLNYVQGDSEIETQAIQRLMSSLKDKELSVLIEKTNSRDYVEYVSKTHLNYLQKQSELNKFYSEISDNESQWSTLVALEKGLKALITMIETIYPLKNGKVQKTLNEIFESIQTSIIENRN